MADRDTLTDFLKRTASERGISIDGLVEMARDTDRAGYASSTLREMLYGKRTLQLRAVIAFGKALDVDLKEEPEYRLRLVHYLIDEKIHGSRVALANLESLEIAYLPELSEKQVQAIPVTHRKSLKEASDKARSTKSRSS